jgi:hypothetical protein
MSEEKKALDRVEFGHGYDVCIMGIDGTWRRDCLLTAVSDNDAVLTVEGSIEGLNLKEFFCSCPPPVSPIGGVNLSASTAAKWISSPSTRRPGKRNRPTVPHTSDPILTFAARSGRHFCKCWNQRTTSKYGFDIRITHSGYGVANVKSTPLAELPHRALPRRAI